jgi:hypothetical protein
MKKLDIKNLRCFKISLEVANSLYKEEVNYILFLDNEEKQERILFDINKRLKLSNEDNCLHSFMLTLEVMDKDWNEYPIKRYTCGYNKEHKTVLQERPYNDKTMYEIEQEIVFEDNKKMIKFIVNDLKAIQCNFIQKKNMIEEYLTCIND